MERSDNPGRRRQLPGTLAEVDAEFIASVLARNDLPDDVRTVAWERIGTDRGISSMVGRLRLAYAGSADGVATLIVKLASEPVSDDVDTVEVDFYRRLARRSPLDAPRCFFAASDIASGRLTIVLEDLRGLDSPGDVEGLDLERASAAVEALAEFHGCFAPVADTHSWTREVDASEAARMEAGLDRNLAETLKRSERRLEPEQAAICERLPGRMGAIMALLSQPPRTLTHGDYRADNLFFRADGSVVAVDWEGLARQRGGFDLGMFLGTSLGKDAFAAHWQELVDTYANSVQRAGFDYPRREIERDMRLGLLLQLAWASCVFSEPVLGTGRPLRVVETWLDRLTRAAIRLDAFAALEAV